MPREWRYCPWCFKAASGTVCEEPECNRASMRTSEDVVPSEARPFHGLVVDWRYRVTKYVFTGGYGAVCWAYDRFTDRMVAVKFLCKEPTAVVSDRVRQRFEREATILGRLRHQNIVRLHDVEGIRDGPPCIIMELLRGSDLEITLQNRGRLTPTEAIQWLLPVCDALQYAHGQGVLHLDIKPSNIFRHQNPSGDEVVKVLDFGIARIRGGDLPQGQGVVRVYGTAQYIAPEVATGQRPAEASDLYSLGAVLYECLCGQPPFDGADDFEVRQAHVENAVPPLPEDFGVPQDLVALVFCLLEKKAGRRPRSAREVRHRLAQILSRLQRVDGSQPKPPPTDTNIVRVHQTPTPTGVTEATHAPQTRWRRLKVFPLLGAFIVGLLAGIAIARADACGVRIAGENLRQTTPGIVCASNGCDRTTSLP